MQSRTFLKRLDDDCLLDGALHPSIRQRLERVQQLPMTALANLHGVRRQEEGVFLLWEFVDGRTLEQLDDRTLYEREVRHLVEALHAHGMVHGAIHPRNVIVDDRGVVRLTHVSPLLFSDPGIDLAALEKMFGTRHRVAEDAAGLGPGNAIGPRAILAAGLAAVAGLIIAASLFYFASTTQ